MSDFDDDEPGANDSVADGTEADDTAARRPARRRPVEDDWDDDDWDDDDDRGGRRDMTLIVVIAVAVAIIALVVILTRPKDKSDDAGKTGGSQTTETTKPDDGGFACDQWPGVVGGNGSAVAKGEGIYIWSDFQGFHVRSNRTDAIVVKITTPAPFKVKDAGGATATAKQGQDITLTIPPGDGKKGPDLDLSCDVTTVSFEVTAGGNPVPASDIKLGDSGKADQNPVTLGRGQP